MMGLRLFWKNFPSHRGRCTPFPFGGPAKEAGPLTGPPFFFFATENPTSPIYYMHNLEAYFWGPPIFFFLFSPLVALLRFFRGLTEDSPRGGFPSSFVLSSRPPRDGAPCSSPLFFFFFSSGQLGPWSFSRSPPLRGLSAFVPPANGISGLSFLSFLRSRLTAFARGFFLVSFFFFFPSTPIDDGSPFCASHAALFVLYSFFFFRPALLFFVDG